MTASLNHVRSTLAGARSSGAPATSASRRPGVLPQTLGSIQPSARACSPSARGVCGPRPARVRAGAALAPGAEEIDE